MPYQTLVTTLGLAKIAAAVANDSTVALFEMALGDGNGNPVSPSVSQTSLAREVYRDQLNVLRIDENNPNYLIAELVVPTTEGGWTVREVGLYDNAGALIAVGNFPDTYKPILSEGAARDLVVRMVIEVAQPDALTLSIDPRIVLATRQWVADNFTLAIGRPGGTTGEVLRKRSNADGDFEWYDPASGLNITVNTVEELQTLAASQTVVTLAIATTTGAAIYVEGIRLFSDDYTVDDETHITLAESYPAGSKILIVQNEPLSSFEFLEKSRNLGEIADAGPAAQAAAIANLGLASNADLLAAIRASVFGALYPVGEILITRRAGAPNTWLGFGTWERYGAGRTIVGYDAADASFNALDATGGAKTHTLTAGEIPAHVHSVDPPSATTSSAGTHTHFVANSTAVGGSAPDASAGTSVARRFNSTGSGEYYLKAGVADADVGLTSSGGAHAHTLDIAAFNSGSAGGGAAHNNLPPYIVAFMWRRTA